MLKQSPFKMIATALLATICLAQAQAAEIKAFSLTQIGDFVYDAAPEGQAKTPAQNAVDYIYGLGGRHVVLTPEATMTNNTATIITLRTVSDAIAKGIQPGAALAQERNRYTRIINYIHSKGMTVGIRPIFLVQDPVFIVTKYNPVTKMSEVDIDPATRRPKVAPGVTAWHGNITPLNVQAWFESFRGYLMTYANFAKLAKVEEFTVGAELYSMTVGIEDVWKEQPYGFPLEFGVVLKDIKNLLGPTVRIMYDINYADVSANANGTGGSGGEFERWRYRLADLKPDPSKPQTMSPASVDAWNKIRDLWMSFDAAGIDIYRSLMNKGSPIPGDYNTLVTRLADQAMNFAIDMDTKLAEISAAVGVEKQVMLKEVGFKSCTGCFINPYEYDDSKRQVNIDHQAAAYEAMFRSITTGGWTWYAGSAFWDISVNPARQGVADPGFTPRGKAKTEEVIRKYWNK